MIIKLKTFLFFIFYLLEKFSAYLQGKGYGQGTISQEVNSVSKFLPLNPRLAIDMGGNVGNYSKQLRKKYSDIEIHIFEPSSTNIQILTKKFIVDNLIKLNHFGISNFSGKAELFSNEPGSGLGSLSKRNLDHFGINFEVSEEVDVIKFEDYWKTILNSRPIDLVKIDIEGHELNALKSFGSALEYARVIQFEFGGCNIDTRTYFQDFYYFFIKNKFLIYRITPFGIFHILKYREIDESFLTTNYIAVNQRYKSFHE